MAKSLHKNSRLTIRFTDEQSSRLERQAKAESRKRGERIEESTLARELILRGIEQLEADTQPTAAGSPA